MLRFERKGNNGDYVFCDGQTQAQVKINLHQNAAEMVLHYEQLTAEQKDFLLRCAVNAAMQWADTIYGHEEQLCDLGFDWDGQKYVAHSADICLSCKK